jgi:outer membrane receptor for Fe3+-dicitrate
MSKTTKKSKSEMVKDYLIQNKQITSWDAIKMFKATRLSAIIFNLRDKGYLIDSVDTKGRDGIRFSTYKLISEPKTKK